MELPNISSLNLNGLNDNGEKKTNICLNANPGTSTNLSTSTNTNTSTHLSTSSVTCNQTESSTSFCEASTSSSDSNVTSKPSIPSCSTHPSDISKADRDGSNDDIIECFYIDNGCDEYVNSNLDWVNTFIHACLISAAIKYSDKLDKLMEEFLVHVRREQDYCTRSPKRAFFISKFIRKCFIFFYYTYNDIRDYSMNSKYNEIMIELIYLYTRMEMHATKRVPRGENDLTVSTRITNLMWIMLDHNEMAILDVLLKIGNSSSMFSKRYREMLVPMFRKILTYTHPRKFIDEENYIRVVLAFKTWRKIVYSYERNSLTECTLSKIIKPPTFPKNYHHYPFLPILPIGVNVDCHEHFVTANIDLSIICEKFFKYLKKKQKGQDLICAPSTAFNKFNFLSTFCKTFDGKTEDEDLWEAPLLESIKQKTETLDDDEISIPRSNQSSSEVITINDEDEAEVIDLTNEDEEDESTPVWAECAISAAEKEKINIPPETPKPKTFVVINDDVSDEIDETNEDVSEDIFIEPVCRFDQLNTLKSLNKPLSTGANVLLDEMMEIPDETHQQETGAKMVEMEDYDEVNRESKNTRTKTVSVSKESNSYEIFTPHESNYSLSSSDVESPPFESLSNDILCNNEESKTDKENFDIILQKLSEDIGTIPKISAIQGSVNDWTCDGNSEENISRSILNENNEDELLSSDVSMNCDDFNDKVRGIISKFSDMSEEALLRDDIEIGEEGINGVPVPHTDNINQLIENQTPSDVSSQNRETEIDIPSVNEALSDSDKRMEKETANDIVKDITDEFSTLDTSDETENFKNKSELPKPDIEIAEVLKDIQVKGAEDINFGVSITPVDGDQISINTYLPTENEKQVSTEPTEPSTELSTLSISTETSSEPSVDPHISIEQSISVQSVQPSISTEALSNVPSLLITPESDHEMIETDPIDLWDRRREDVSSKTETEDSLDINEEFFTIPKRQFNIEEYKQEVFKLLNKTTDDFKFSNKFIADDDGDSADGKRDGDETKECAQTLDDEEQSLLEVKRTSSVKQYGKKSSDSKSNEDQKTGRTRRNSVESKSKKSVVPGIASQSKIKTEPLKSLLKTSHKSTHKNKHVHFGEKLEEHEIPSNNKGIGVSRDGGEMSIRKDSVKPSVGKEFNKPSTSKDFSKLKDGGKMSIDKDVGKPSTGKDLSKTSTGMTFIKPSTSKDLSKPNTSKDLNKPSTSKDVGKSITSKDLSKPSTSKEFVKPSISKDLSKPSIGKDFSKPSTSKDLGKPSTSKIHKPEINLDEIKLGRGSDAKMKPSGKSGKTDDNKDNHKNKCISRVFKNKASVQHHADAVSDNEVVKGSDSDDSDYEVNAYIARKVHPEDVKKRRRFDNPDSNSDSEHPESDKEEIIDNRRKRRNSFTKKSEDILQKYKKSNKITGDDTETKDSNATPRRGRKKKKIESSDDESKKSNDNKTPNFKQDIDLLHTEISKRIRNKTDIPDENLSDDNTRKSKNDNKKSKNKSVHSKNSVKKVDKRPRNTDDEDDDNDASSDASYNFRASEENIGKNRTGKNRLGISPLASEPGHIISPTNEMVLNEPDDDKHKKLNETYDESNKSQLTLCKDLTIKLIKEDALISTTCGYKLKINEDIPQINGLDENDDIANFNMDDNFLMTESLPDKLELPVIINTYNTNTEQGQFNSNSDIVNSENCDNLNINVKNVRQSEQLNNIHEEYRTIAQPSASTVPNSIFEKFVEQKQKNDRPAEIFNEGAQSVLSENNIPTPVNKDMTLEANTEMNKENEENVINTNQRKEDFTNPTPGSSKSIFPGASDDVNDVFVNGVRKPQKNLRVYKKTIKNKMKSNLTLIEKYLMKRFKFDYDDLRSLDIEIVAKKQKVPNECRNIVIGQMSVSQNLIQAAKKTGGRSLIIERQDYSKNLNSQSQTLRARIERRPTPLRNGENDTDPFIDPSGSNLELENFHLNRLDIINPEPSNEAGGSSNNIFNIDNINLGNTLDTPSNENDSLNINFLSNNVKYPRAENNNVAVPEIQTVPPKNHHFDPVNGVCSIPTCPLSHRTLIIPKSEPKYHDELIWENPNENILSSVNSMVPNAQNISIPYDSFDDIDTKNYESSPCTSPEHETHLPIKKRRLSSIKTRLLQMTEKFAECNKDAVRLAMVHHDIEISYPATPMISIAELEDIPGLENIKSARFRTPAELKEIPPLSMPQSLPHTYASCLTQVPIQPPQHPSQLQTSLQPPPQIQAAHQSSKRKTSQLQPPPLQPPPLQPQPLQPPPHLPQQRQPPLPPPLQPQRQPPLLQSQPIQIEQPLSINHTYNNPTINYHIGTAPLMNFNYTPDPTAYSIPLILTTNKNVNNLDQASYYTTVPQPSTSKETQKKKTQGRGRSKESTTNTKNRNRKSRNNPN